MKVACRTFAGGALMVLGLSACTENVTLTVCPEGNTADVCDFIGDTAIQQAVDAVVDGGAVYVKAGSYKAASYKDAPFQEPYPDYIRDVQVRGMVMVDGKKVSIIGEDGVQLTGNPDFTTSAIVVHDGGLRLENIAIQGFSVSEPEDTIYDGHGIFVIDSKVAIKSVTINDLTKMAIVVRGKSEVAVENAHISGSHMGLWLEEEGQFSLRDAVISGNHTGLGMYGNTQSHIKNTIIKDNSDDGVYALGNAQVILDGVTVEGNSPRGLNVKEKATLTFESGALYGNAVDMNVEDGGAAVSVAASVTRSEAQK